VGTIVSGSREGRAQRVCMERGSGRDGEGGGGEQTRQGEGFMPRWRRRWQGGSISRTTQTPPPY
jgi:hypothetical protein